MCTTSWRGRRDFFKFEWLRVEERFIGEVDLDVEEDEEEVGFKCNEYG